MVRLSFENVSKRFGDVSALRGVSLGITSGERVAVVGPSGSGKTTLLRLSAGLITPTSGTVRLDGEDAAAGGGASAAVAMVFQNLALFPHLSGFDNIALGLRARKTPKSDVARRIADMAELLDLREVLRRKPHQLSGGERQRVALARALVKQPSVLLLDEPFANLDAHLRAELRCEFIRLHTRFAMTMLCVTHDLIEAVAFGQRIAVLNRGVIEQFDTPERLLESPASPFVRSFLSTPEIADVARHACLGRRER